MEQISKLQELINDKADEKLKHDVEDYNKALDMFLALPFTVVQAWMAKVVVGLDNDLRTCIHNGNYRVMQMMKDHYKEIYREDETRQFMKHATDMLEQLEEPDQAENKHG